VKDPETDMPDTIPTRDDLATRYIDQLRYAPYPVQEQALLAWFTADQGVLVCAPTGTGKTLIAQAALFEALHTRKIAYYTTPLIALTEQKFREMQASAVEWGFSADDVGLVTGNRRVNPNARVLVVVAEILLNRLLHQAGDIAGAPGTDGGFDFTDVSAVVMDEFHSFADPERGIVWELSLSMLPKHIRLLLLSATVGNSMEFLNWLERAHGRRLELVEGKDRKVPLSYRWVPNMLLGEQMVEMAQGDETTRKTPALLFCFNRDECWSVAEMLKGLTLLSGEQRKRVNDEVDRLDWTQGVGPKLVQMLRRGVGVHHAGMLPKYRRAVEDLFNRKLLAVCVCTETLASGINLPARSVVLTSLVKGPPGKMKLIDASTAHQIFGRAGRPQFDKEGFVYALAHEDDVKILRWKEKYDQIPETTKDPTLLRAKKALKKKKPSRRETMTYWSEAQFGQLQAAPPGRLYSKGSIPWRLLAYLLKVSPEVAKVRNVIRKRLMDEPRIRAGEKALDRMLLTLAEKGYVTLDPPPPPPRKESSEPDSKGEKKTAEAEFAERVALAALSQKLAGTKAPPPVEPAEPSYSAILATATPALDKLLVFRSIHPLYGAYLIDHLGIADLDERIQAFESVLEMPRPLLRYVRVPHGERPPGPLENHLDPELISRGLIATPLPPKEDDEEEEEEHWSDRPPVLAEKLRLYFDALYPEVGDLNTQGVWCAGELLRFSGNFNLFVKTRDLVKQEGIVFRHLLRLILMLGEFMQVTPPRMNPEDWQKELRELSDQLTASCRTVDPTSTDELIQLAHAADVVEGETGTAVVPPSK
jgi:superfamily II DNA/RNA helicase